jgi:hypothetical protein
MILNAGIKSSVNVVPVVPAALLLTILLTNRPEESVGPAASIPITLSILSDAYAEAGGISNLILNDPPGKLNGAEIVYDNSKLPKVVSPATGGFPAVTI